MRNCLVGIFLIALTTGCTRDVGEKSNFTLSFPDPPSVSSKVGALAMRTTFIAINVSGPNFRQVQIWDRHHEKHKVCPTGCATPPPINPKVNFEFNDVPNGATLIQVLRIREEVTASGDEGDGEIFQYAQQNTDLTGGDVPVTINGFENFDATTGKEGSVHGRYRLPNGDLPTGEMALMFDPGAGREPMEIFREEVFAGWFNMFLFENLNLRYVHPESGHIFFGQSLNINSAPFSMATANAHNSVFRFETPKTFKDCTDCGDEESDEEIHVLGFWNSTGAPDTVASVCHDTTSVTSNHEYLEDTHVTKVNWPSHFTTSSGPLCTSPFPDPAVTAGTMAVDGNLIERSGGDQLNFRGPYMSFDNGSAGFSIVHTSHSGSDLTVSWKYLTGVRLPADGVAGTTVFFKRNVADHFDFDDGGASKSTCEDLLDDGFETKNATGGQESVVINGIAQSELSDMEVILCARRKNVKPGQSDFFKTTAKAYCIGGCGGPGPVATKFKIKMATRGGIPPHVNNNVCTPLEFISMDNNNQPAHLPNTPYVVDLNFGAGTLYTDHNCSTPVPSTGNNFNLNGSFTSLWYKGNITPGTNTSISITPVAGETTQLLPMTLTMPHQAPSPVDGMSILINPNLFVEELNGGCEVLIVNLVDNDDVPTFFTITPGGGNITFSSSISGMNFKQSDCSTPSSTINPSSNVSGYVQYFQPTLTGSGNITATSSITSPSSLPRNVKNSSISISDPTATYARVEKTNGTVGNNQCMELTIKTYKNTTTSGSVLAKIPSAETYSVSATGVTGDFFLNNSDCSGPTNSQGSTINVGQSASTSASTSVWFRPSQTGPVNFEFDGDATNDDNFDADSDQFNYP